MANGQDHWSISASLLNVLWGRLLPRAAALVWHPSNVLAWPEPGTDARPWFRKVIHLFLPNPLPAQLTTFQKRLIQLRSYLMPGRRSIPIRYWGEGAYDFVLSEDGLDLFAPPAPRDRTEILHYYTFRRTGRPPIGLPATFIGKARRPMMSAPTGPGQILIPIGALARLNDQPVEGQPCGAEEEEVHTFRWLDLGELPRLWRGLEEQAARARDDLGEEYERRQDEILRHIEGDGPRVEDVEEALRDEDVDEAPEDEDVEQAPGDDDDGRGIRGPGLPVWIHEEDLPAFLVDDLCCFKALANRAWQVEGSVYRGILEEFPRVLATIWWEESAGAAPPLVLSDYARRYGHNVPVPAQPGQPASNRRDTFRAIFRERIETSLPDSDDMVFADTGQVPPNLPPGVAPVPDFQGVPLWLPRMLWDDDDVMITDRGFFFPQRQPAPNAGNILKAIIQGRAGNPVFTDSAPCIDEEEN